MSITIDEATLTIQQRSAAATRALCEVLGLGALKPADLKYLALALTQAATEEARYDSAFADRIRALLQSLLPAKPAPRKPRDEASGLPGRRRGAVKRIDLVPVGRVDETLLDPYAPPNPWALQQLYGNDQLPAALDRYSLAKVKDALALMQRRYPDMRPKRMTKSGIIDYIVEQVVNPA